MTRLAEIAVLLLLVAPSSVAGAEEARQLEAQSLSDSDQLERGRQVFLNGEYADAQRLLAAVSPMELGRDQRILLHEMMGKAHYILGDAEAAEEHFFEVLKLDKAHELDPVSTPEQIRILFEATRMSRRAHLKPFPVELERTIPGRDLPLVAPRDMIVAFAPAGIFRWTLLRQPKIGVPVFLAGQILPLGLSIGSYFYLSWAYDNLQYTDVTNAYAVMYVVNMLASTVFLVVYAVGIVDAFASQRYHGQSRSGRKRKVAAGWRWGPPIAALPPGPD